MNIKNIILTSLFAVGCISASAQQEVKKEEVFQPHWYGGVQVGMQHTLGEIDWSDLNSLNAQLTAGYQFTPIWGARIALDGFQSKAGTAKYVANPLSKQYQWSWNFIAPTVDATFNVTNALFGFNPDRKVDFSVFAGIGANFAWGNDEAKDAHNAIQKEPAFQNAVKIDKSCPNRLLWEDSKAFFVSQFGADVDYNINRNLSLGLEFSSNMVGDAYNSKKAGNIDWYFNTLLGVKYKFGETTKVRYTTIEDPCPARVEYIHDTIYVQIEAPAKDMKEPIRRDIFFVLRGTKIDDAQLPKIQDLVSYLYKYPESTISITGYADRGTGNPRINVGYADKRAKAVANMLAEKFGIARSRMIVTSKGDTEQPFSENDSNRVSICIAE